MKVIATMTFERDPNDRRRVDAEIQRNRDAEVARMRRAGVPFRTIASRLDMSLGAVQKAARRAQKLADAMASGEPGDVVAVLDDELRAADVTWVADIAKLSPLEHYRLRHMPGPFGDAARARPWTEHAVEYQRERAERREWERDPPGQDWYTSQRFHVFEGRSRREGVDRAMAADSGHPQARPRHISTKTGCRQALSDTP